MPLWECILRHQCLGQGRIKEWPVASRDTLPKGRSRAAASVWPGRRAASRTRHLPLARWRQETEQPAPCRQTLWPLLPSYSASVTHCTKAALAGVVGSLLNRSSSVKARRRPLLPLQSPFLKPDSVTVNPTGPEASAPPVRSHSTSQGSI